MAKTKNILLFLFWITCTMLSLPAHTQDKEVILQKGNPPLTQSHLKKIIAFMEWALDGKFSAAQSARLQQNLISVWKNENQEDINGVLSIVETYDQLVQMKEQDRRNAKANIQEVLLQNMKRDPDDEMSKLLMEVYNASHSTTPNTGNTNRSPEKSIKNPLRTGADGFTGIYRMVRPKALNINSSGYERGYIIEYITFLPGGKLYWSLPPEGLLYFDSLVAKQSHPDDWGTYEFKGNEIHVLRGPDKRKYVITRNGDRLNNPPSLGKGSFRPIPNCDGLVLEGNYRRHESEPSISFTKDGKFKEGGIFRNFGTRGRLDGSTYQDDGVAGSGTYIIEQNTLELRYTDGRIKRFPFIAFPENLAKKPAIESFLLYEDRLERF